MKKLLLFIALAVILLVLILSVIMFFVAKSIYDGSFNCRYETSDEDTHDISEFEGLTRERHTFKSNSGQTLVGYLYKSSDENEKSKAVIVFAHGMGGGGQRGFMDIYNFMASKGYCIFAYDATANDESEGEAVGGLPQGFIDLDHAITYAKTLDEVNDLPFVLMGYSWGGLSVTNALNYHPDVKAVVSLAGWNESMDLIEYRGCQMAGDAAKALIPFARVYEAIKYGKYAFSSSMKGFENSECAVMVVHSDDDDTVPIRYGYETYQKKYSSDPRFVFKKYSGRGHSLLVDSEKNLDLHLMSEIADWIAANL